MVETGLESCHSHNPHDLNSPCMVQHGAARFAMHCVIIACASSRQPLAPRALGEAVARRVASSPHASEGVCEGSPVIGALSLSFEHFELGMW